MMTDEQKARMRLWTAALLSDEFAQGQGALRTHVADMVDVSHYRYCCLGVATEVAIRNGCEIEDFDAETIRSWGPEDNPDDEHPFWLINDGELCPSVAKWYGFNNGDPVVGERTENRCDSPDCDNYDEDCDHAVPRTIKVPAIEANDDLKWDFVNIAEGIAHIYELGDIHVQPAAADGDRPESSGGRSEPQPA